MFTKKIVLNDLLSAQLVKASREKAIEMNTANISSDDLWEDTEYFDEHMMPTLIRQTMSTHTAIYTHHQM